MKSVYHWQFPLLRTHTGMLQGNARMGVMVWGEKSLLKLTIGRVDYWDHRGGVPWSEDISYKNIAALLSAGDEEGMTALFSPKKDGSQKANSHEEDAKENFTKQNCPTLLPIGRVELEFSPDIHLQKGELLLGSGEIHLILVDQINKASYAVNLALSMDSDILCVSFPPECRPKKIHMVTAWNYVAKKLTERGFEATEPFEKDDVSGWTQKRPNDGPLCVAYTMNEDSFWLTTMLAQAQEGAKQINVLQNSALTFLKERQSQGIEALREKGDSWWNNYWNTVPKIDIPNAKLDFIYHYGLYKFAGLTNPAGVAAGLQGPWLEEYQMPPWSADYHFNINVQMCYWPAYRTGLWSHLKPLFTMIESWLPILKENARHFVGIEDGYILPHAVDDRCVAMGGFWTGAIDHGCTAWMAQMMYQYYSYSGDKEFLERLAYPFMKGTLKVYQAMLQDKDGTLKLPISVSPEYRGSQMNAWGANSSFQLGAIHSLLEGLQESSRILGEEPDPAWSDIERRLPKVCLVKSDSQLEKEEIALWEGVALEESHRHHSHLAGLYPFDVINTHDPKWKAILNKTFQTWVYQGMGLWSGWCVPWASILHARVGNGDMAELLLEMWDKVYTNEGHGTLHDPQFGGFSLLGKAPIPDSQKHGPTPNHEIMQIEAGMAACSAVMEMLLYSSRGVHYVFKGIPESWKDVVFERIRAEGGFEVSAKKSLGEIVNIEVKSLRSGLFQIQNPWKRVKIIRQGENESQTNITDEHILSLSFQKDDIVQLLCAE